MAIGDVTGGTTTSGQVTFTGLGNGTDFNSLVEKLVQVEQSRLRTYQTWKQSWLDKNVAFKALNTEMLTLRSSLQSMDTIGEFLKKTAASTNSDALTATAGGDAETGTTSYTVAQLAKNKTMVTGAGYASPTQNINTLGAAAKFTYTYKGVTVSNAIPANCTLNDLAAIINVNSANKGVRATTIFDGTNYYLQLKGLDTGAAASLVVSGASTLPNFKAANFSVTQNNQDAKLKINGWPLSNAYITRPTNTISDVVAGLTLSLKSSGSGLITVDTDIDSVVENVKTFVSQVNKVRSMIRELTRVDSTTKQASILTGNYGLQICDSIMKNITAADGVGFSYLTDKYTSLSPLGLSTDAVEGSNTEGLIMLDEAMLRSQLASNANAVGLIFAGTYVGDTDSSDISYNSYISGLTKAGNYKVSYTMAGGKVTAATIGGHPATFDPVKNTITGKAGTPEAGMVVQVNNNTDGSYTHTVNLRLGKAPELVDELADLTNADTGPLNILQKNYVTISDNIQKKIDYENKRISAYAQSLKNKFSKLDALLGTYNQQQTSLASQITQMSKS
ncbi:MAG: flagellar filament capping protein FliD [Acidobacteriota bacterium]